MQCIKHITYKVCVNGLFILVVGLPVNSKLLEVKLQGVESYMGTFDCMVGCCRP